MNHNRFEKHSKKILVTIFSLLLIFVVAFIETLLALTTKEQAFSDQTRYIRLKEHSPLTTRYLLQNPQYPVKEDIAGGEHRFKIDVDGYIFPSRVHEQADLNLLFLGGSTTECSVVEEESRFPYLVGRLLESDTKTINAFNSGVSGNHSMHSINILLNKGIALKPDVAVMMHNINDLNFLLYENNYWNNNPTRSLIVVSDHKDTMQYIRYAVRSVVPQLYHRLSVLKNKYLIGDSDHRDEFSHIRGKKMPVNRLVVIEQFRRSLLTFVAVSRANQIYPVLMTQANRLKEDPDKAIIENWTLSNDFGIDYPEYQIIYDAMNEAIRQVAKANHVLLIDLAKEVPQEESHMYDPVHLNTHGSKFVASIVSERLKKVLDERLTDIGED